MEHSKLILRSVLIGILSLVLTNCGPSKEDLEKRNKTISDSINSTIGSDIEQMDSSVQINIDTTPHKPVKPIHH